MSFRALAIVVPMFLLLVSCQSAVSPVPEGEGDEVVGIDGHDLLVGIWSLNIGVSQSLSENLLDRNQDEVVGAIRRHIALTGQYMVLNADGSGYYTSGFVDGSPRGGVRPYSWSVRSGQNGATMTLVRERYSDDYSVVRSQEDCLIVRFGRVTNPSLYLAIEKRQYHPDDLFSPTVVVTLTSESLIGLTSQGD